MNNAKYEKSFAFDKDTLPLYKELIWLHGINELKYTFLEKCNTNINNVLSYAESQFEKALQEPCDESQLYAPREIPFLSVLCGLFYTYGYTDKFWQLALKSLPCDEWHDRHEDFVLDMGVIQYEPLVDVVESYIYKRYEVYDYDDSEAFARKCLYALRNIGTSKAMEIIERFSITDDRENLTDEAKEFLEDYKNNGDSICYDGYLAHIMMASRTSYGLMPKGEEYIAKKKLDKSDVPDYISEIFRNGLKNNIKNYVPLEVALGLSICFDVDDELIDSFIREYQKASKVRMCNPDKFWFCFSCESLLFELIRHKKYEKAIPVLYDYIMSSLRNIDSKEGTSHFYKAIEALGSLGTAEAYDKLASISKTHPCYEAQAAARYWCANFEG